MPSFLSAQETLPSLSERDEMLRRMGRLEQAERDKRTKEFENLRKTQSPRPPDYSEKRKNFNPTKLTFEEKRRLEANPADLAAFTDFLKLKDTGLMKFYPDYGCFGWATVSVEGMCENAIALSFAYSFRRGERVYDTQTEDLHLRQERFLAGKGAAHGIISALGDFPLNELSVSSDAISFLANYQPASTREQFVQKKADIEAGLRSGKYYFSNQAPILIDNTYALRVIAYRSVTPKNSYIPINSDKRIDILLVFRVIRKDSDGGVTLLWKVLRRGESPKIKFFG